MKHEQVVVGKFKNEVDAEIAKGHLESEGIEASIAKNDAGRMFPSLQYTEGVELSVDKSQEEKARIIIRPKHIT
jgi:Putative prokaryotic signal transducing protein